MEVACIRRAWSDEGGHGARVWACCLHVDADRVSQCDYVRGSDTRADWHLFSILHSSEHLFPCQRALHPDQDRRELLAKKAAIEHPVVNPRARVGPYPTALDMFQVRVGLLRPPHSPSHYAVDLCDRDSRLKVAAERAVPQGVRSADGHHGPCRLEVIDLAPGPQVGNARGFCVPSVQMNYLILEK